MIQITVYLEEGDDWTFETRKGSVQEVLDAAKLLFPDWSKIVLTLHKEAPLR